MINNNTIEKLILTTLDSICEDINNENLDAKQTALKIISKLEHENEKDYPSLEIIEKQVDKVYRAINVAQCNNVIIEFTNCISKLLETMTSGGTYCLITSPLDKDGQVYTNTNDGINFLNHLLSIIKYFMINSNKDDYNKYVKMFNNFVIDIEKSKNDDNE